MLKEKTSIINLCDWVVKIGIYISIALIPLFFLPWSFDGLDFTKQALFIFVIFTALFAWILKTLVSGTLNFGMNKVHIIVGVLFLAYLVSTIFSLSSHGSLWGWPQPTVASLISIICFCIFYFLVANEFSQKEIFNSFVLMGVSMGIAQIYGILQLLGLHIIPLDFAQSNFFNSLGSVGSLAFLSAIMAMLFIVILPISKTWQKMLFAVNILLALAMLLLINYVFVWLLALAGSLIIIIFWFTRRDVFDGRWMFLPMFFLIVSVFFVIFQPQLKWIPEKPLEVSLSNKSSWPIVFQTIKASPIWGSGPGTFIYDFSKYKDSTFNVGSLWNMEFNAASSKVLTDLATVGILGSLAWFLLVGFSVFYAVKTLTVDRSFAKTPKASSEADVLKISMLLSSFVMFAVASFGYFLYNPNLSLELFWYFSLAVMVALIFKDKNRYVLKSSSLSMLVITFVATGFFIFGLGFLVLEGQRYYANVNYYRGLKAFSVNQKDEAMAHFKVAASNNKSLDYYYRQLTIFSLVNLREKVSAYGQGGLNDEEKTQIQALVQESVNYANTSVSLNSKNFANWSAKGYMCQNLIGLNPDAVECALKSYDEAIALYPANPYLYFQQGNVYLSQIDNLTAPQLGQKNELLEKAKEKFNKAIELKEDYALAYIQLAQIAKAQNDSGAVSLALQNATKYSARNSNIALQIGLAYYRDNNFVKAQAEFQRALSLNPNYANALYYSGLTYDKQGQKNNAIARFTRLSETNPGNEDVQKILANLRAGKSALDGMVQNPPAPIPPVTAPETETAPEAPVQNQ